MTCDHLHLHVPLNFCQEVAKYFIKLSTVDSDEKYNEHNQPGADLGGWGGLADASSFQGFNPLPTQRVPPLVLLRNPVLADDQP